MKQAIRMVRGTTHPIGVELRNGSDVYTLKDNEVLRFGIKKTEDGETLLSKEMTKANLQDGEYVLILNPADTASLAPGGVLLRRWASKRVNLYSRD